jgi:hypothetical protein
LTTSSTLSTSSTRFQSNSKPRTNLLTC